MLQIQKWKGAPPKDGISSWCEVQGVRLSKVRGDSDLYEYYIFVLSGTENSRVRPVHGKLILPAELTFAVYGGLQVFDARVNLHKDGSADLLTLFIGGTEVDVEPDPIDAKPAT